MTQVTLPTEATTLVGNVGLVPACKAVDVNGSCVTPDVGVISVTAVSAPALNGDNSTNVCAGLTWSVTDNLNGTFSLSHTGTVTFPANLAQCTLNFSFSVLTLPTADFNAATPNILDTAGSANGTITDGVRSASGIGSTDTPFSFVCSVLVDKQVSCNGGTDWFDAGLVSQATDDGANGCIGVANAADIKVRYQAKNTSDSGIGLVSCTIGESNTNLGPGVTSFPIANGATTSFLGTTDSPLTCNSTLTAGEADTATINCTCNVPLATQPTATANDSATFGCCGVQVDKQISCDGGTTFTDTGLQSSNGDGSNGCIGKVGVDDIVAQYQAKNLGTLPASCTFSDSNTVFNSLIPANTFSTIGAGSTTSLIPLSGSTGTCEAALAGGEPDTATLNCTCSLTGAANFNAQATDSANFGCCGIQVDKQVSCNGGPLVDPGFGTTCQNNGGTGCTAESGQSVDIKYQIKNVGSVDASGCTIADANNGGTFYGPVSVGGTITANGGLGPVTDNPTNPGTCSTTFSQNEPNTASAACDCSAPLLGTQHVTADSCNKITCTEAHPNYTISKTCTPQTTNGNYDIGVTITNLDNTTGTTLSCTVTDTVYAGACPPSGSPLTTVTLSPGTVNVGASTGSCDPTTGSGCTTGTASGTLTGQTQGTCDQVSATCTPSSGTLSMPTQSATAVCPFGSCFTRTPGYWGTHPNQTQAVISSVGGSLPVCGIGVTNVGLGVNSAIQNICESAQDAKKGKGNSFYTSTQQLQLIRQCTAAALNLAATGLGSTSAGEISCEGVSSGITADFNRCCGTGTDQCSAGLKGTDIDVTGCIGILDTFNNKFDNVDFPSIYPNEAANSSTCSAATGDGLTNCSSDSLGGGINCGKP